MHTGTVERIRAAQPPFAAAPGGISSGRRGYQVAVALAQGQVAPVAQGSTNVSAAVSSGERFAQELHQAWGLGEAGVLLLVVVKDHRIYMSLGKDADWVPRAQLQAVVRSMSR